MAVYYAFIAGVNGCNLDFSCCAGIAGAGAGAGVTGIVLLSLQKDLVQGIQ